MSSPLEPFIPAYDAREHFAVRVHASATRTFAIAAAFDLLSPWPVRAIFRLREILLRSHAASTAVAKGLLENLTALGWGQLLSEPGHLYIGCAYCQPWLADVRFTPLTAASFPTFREPGHVKIAWTLETLPLTATSCLLRTETRATATDPEARQHFTTYWRWARFGILPIRWFLLPAIRRKAERATAA